MKSKLTGVDVSRQSQNHTIIKSEMEYNDADPFFMKGVPKPTLLARGKYKGYPFSVINVHGTHPCAYVYLPKERDEYPDVHGGITYTGRYPERPLLTVNTRHRKDGVWIGWDYAHSGWDYIPLIPRLGGIKWTTEEVVREVKQFIDELDQ